MITCFYSQSLFLKIHMQLFFMGTNFHIIKEIRTKVTKEVTVLQGPNRSSHLWIASNRGPLARPCQGPHPQAHPRQVPQSCQVRPSILVNCSTMWGKLCSLIEKKNEYEIDVILAHEKITDKPLLCLILHYLMWKRSPFWMLPKG